MLTFEIDPKEVESRHWHRNRVRYYPVERFWTHAWLSSRVNTDLETELAMIACRVLRIGADTEWCRRVSSSGRAGGIGCTIASCICGAVMEPGALSASSREAGLMRPVPAPTD